MEHDLELIIARLEILEIEVCNILQTPGNIGKHIFLIQSYPGNIGNLIFPIFPYPGNVGNMIFLDFGIFTKKTRAEISRRMVRFSRRDLSSETDSGPKTKTVSGVHSWKAENNAKIMRTTVLVFGPESVSYERSWHENRTILREISARVFFVKITKIRFPILPG